MAAAGPTGPPLPRERSRTGQRAQAVPHPNAHRATGLENRVTVSLLSDFLLFRVEHYLHFVFVTVLLKNVCSFLLFFFQVLGFFLIAHFLNPGYTKPFCFSLTNVVISGFLFVF